MAKSSLSSAFFPEQPRVASHRAAETPIRPPQAKDIFEMNTSISAEGRLGLPPPLRVLPDMSPVWLDVDEDFDTAAERLVRAHRIDGPANDLPVLNVGAWGVKAENGEFALAPLARHHPPYRLRANGFANLMNRLGAPVEFMRDRVPEPLQLATLNYLLSQSSFAATLRLRDDEVAAVVSDRYAPLDPAELVETVRGALVRHRALGDVRVRAVATGLVDALRLVFPTNGVAVKVGDVTEIGIDISSSSFARSAVHVRSLLWRLICTNGLRSAERRGGFSFRHVGDAERLKKSIDEAIPSALLEARGVLDQWRQAVGVNVEDLAEHIDQMRELTVAERETVKTEVTKEAGVKELPPATDLYTLINGVTAAARQAEPARRLEIESIGGEVLRRHVTS